MAGLYPNPLAWIDSELAARRRGGLLRQLGQRESPQGATFTADGFELINFGSNDYLGLAGDVRLARAVSDATVSEGWGSGASPLITGRSELHRQLERRLALFEGTEAALLFSSGFVANTAAVAALVGPGDVVFTDRKNHASLFDGCRLSRADVRVYPHCDCQKLARLLAKAASPADRYRRRMIVTDSLFSMDGDLAPLHALADLAEQYGAMLLVDEAHATGVFGAHGRGVAQMLGVEDRVHIHVGTLSKALGCVGGFVAGSQALIDWLVNQARPYVFSTAPPGAMSAAAMKALELVGEAPHRGEELLDRAARLRERLTAAGWNVGQSESQIVPVMLGEPQAAVALSEHLRSRGLFVPAIRPPTVPEGEACLRISLTVGHSDEMIDRLIESLGSVSKR